MAEDFYDMNLDIPGEPQGGDQGDNPKPPAEHEKAEAEKPNIFVRGWRGIKKAHRWINEKISEHPNLAKITLTGIGAGVGIGAKMGYDYFRNRNNAADEFEPEEESYLPEPEEFEPEETEQEEPTETEEQE